MTHVRYEVIEEVGWIEMDDGKVNVMSPTMQQDLHLALDRAEADRVVTVLTGRPGVFSAGFDLGILGGDAEASAAMVVGGFELAARMLAHPRPVVVACTGHAIAMGAFLLLSGDHLIGADGPFKLTANEVAIGLTLPNSADTMLRHRLTPAAHQRAALLAFSFTPTEAREAGFLDEVVGAERLRPRAAQIAAGLRSLDHDAQQATKRRVRAELLARLRQDIELDRNEFHRRLATTSD